MSASADLRSVFDAALPLVERWIALREQFAALRDAATAKGIDWGQVKALAKAHAEDAVEGSGKRVARIVEKADYAASYADMLGLTKLNEKKSFADRSGPARPVASEPAARSADASAAPFAGAGTEIPDLPAFLDRRKMAEGAA